MTDKECFEKLSQFKTDYNKKVEELRLQYEKVKQVALNQWSLDNCPFHVGDIIEVNGHIMKITRIVGKENAYRNSLYSMLHGLLMTKKLQVMKRDPQFRIDDDREIKLLVPHAEVG